MIIPRDVNLRRCGKLVVIGVRFQLIGINLYLTPITLTPITVYSERLAIT